MRLKLRLMLTFAVVVTAGCAGSPTAPAPTPTPSYVIIGDSLGLGAYWPIIEQAIPAQWADDAVGSTTVHVQWQPGGSAFEALRATVTGHPTAFLAHLGANDTVLQPPPTEAGTFADIQRLASALQSAYPGSLLYLAEVGQVWTYGDKRAENQQVRQAIERAWRELPSVRRGPLLQDLTPDDGVHFTSPANVQTLADRWIAILR